MATKKKRGRTAWLVTRRWFNEPQRREVVAIFSSRLGPQRVLEFVELLHLINDYTLQERLDIQWPRHGRISYPARLGQTKEGDPWGGEIYCGNDPFLVARLVDHLVVERDANNVEKPIWKDRPRASSAWMHPEKGAHE